MEARHIVCLLPFDFNSCIKNKKYLHLCSSLSALSDRYFIHCSSQGGKLVKIFYIMNTDVTKLPIFDSEAVPWNYIIIIDSGSQESCAYLYSFSNSTGIVTNPEWSSKVDMAILQSKLNIEEYLDRLIKKIYHLVPIEQHFRTPIYFYDTAGLKNLDPKLQNSYLNKIYKYFTELNFYIPDLHSHVQILDGDIEGLFSWISMNYLLNSATIDSDPLSTFGLLQLSDGSSQICYENQGDSKENSDLLTLKFEQDRSISLFSTPFLGYGLHQFRSNYFNKFLLSGKLMDPCLPSGYSLDKITGSSNFDECLKNIYTIFRENSELCQTELNQIENELVISKCILHSNNLPNSVSIFDNFLAISEYSRIYDTLLALNNAEKQFSDDNNQLELYDAKTFADLTSKICALSFDELVQNYGTDVDPTLCFKSTYMLSLLHSGFGVPFTSDRKLFIQEKLNNTHITWTLGKAILYYQDEINDADIGYYRNFDSLTFYSGAEVNSNLKRPEFKLMDHYQYHKFNRTSKHNIPLILIIIAISIVAVLVFNKKIVKRIIHMVKSRIRAHASTYSFIDNLGPEPIIMTDLERDEIYEDDINGNQGIADQFDEEWDLDNDSDGIEIAV